MSGGRGEDKQWQKANVSHREGLAADEIHFVFNSFFSFPNTLYWFLDIKASDCLQCKPQVLVEIFKGPVSKLSAELYIYQGQRSFKQNLSHTGQSSMSLGA